MRDQKIRRLLVSLKYLAAALALGAIAPACKSGPGVSQFTGSVIAPASLDFGAVAVGGSDALHLLLQGSNTTVALLGVYFDGGDVLDFSPGPLALLQGAGNVDGGTAAGSPDAGLPLADSGGNPGLVLQPGDVADSLLTFHPTGAGLRIANLVVAFDPTGQGLPTSVQTVSLTLTGTGVADSDLAVQVTPTSLDFGAVQLGQYRTLPLTLHNTSKIAITPALGILDDGGFSVGGASGLRVDQAEQLLVTFVAIAEGPARSQLAISPCTGCAVVPVELRGLGVNAQFKFSPEAANFNFVLDGQQAPPITITVAASGNVPVTLDGLSLEQGRTSVFSVANLSVPLGTIFAFPDSGPRSFTFDVTYTPSDFPGGDLDHVQLAYSLNGAKQPPVSLAVMGDRLLGGCRLKLSPGGLQDFGTLLPGASLTKKIEVVNTGGLPCTLSALALDGGLGAAFSLGQGDGGLGGNSYTLPAHAILGGGGLPLTFTAPQDSSAHIFEGALSFASSDPTNSSVSVPLRGEVANPYQASSPWPKWGHDNANSGQSEIDTSHFDGGSLWSFSLITALSQTLPFCGPGPGSYYTNSPVVASRRVFAVGCDGVLYALDELGGGLDFNLSLDPSFDVAGGRFVGVFNTPSVGPDGVLVLSSGSFFQIDPINKIVVSVLDGGGGTSNPAFTLSGAFMYAEGRDGQFFQPQAIVANARPTVGDLICPGFTVSPAIAERGGTVNSFWCSGGVCGAVQPPGLPLWQATIGNDSAADYSFAHGAPVLGDGNLYVLAYGLLDAGLGDGGFDDAGNQLLVQYAATTGAVQALDQATGQLVWSYPLADLPAAPMAAYGPRRAIGTPALSTRGNLLIVPYDTGIVALQAGGPDAGQLAWQLAIDGGALASPAVGADGTIYVSTATAGLLAVDPATHAPRWQFVPRDVDGGAVAIRGAPAIGESGIYFLSDDGVLHAVH